jgi:hypothetical protein
MILTLYRKSHKLKNIKLNFTERVLENATVAQ